MSQAPYAVRNAHWGSPLGVDLKVIKLCTLYTILYVYAVCVLVNHYTRQGQDYLTNFVKLILKFYWYKLGLQQIYDLFGYLFVKIYLDIKFTIWIFHLLVIYKCLQWKWCWLPAIFLQDGLFSHVKLQPPLILHIFQRKWPSI